MGKLWCRDLRVVNVPMQDTPKPITFIYPYYSNATFFARQLEGWDTYPQLVRPHVSAIVVDDGSPEPAALPEDLPIPVRLFRIQQDIRWNWLAARNIGMHHAHEGWCLLTDMDHVVPIETVRAIVYGSHDPDVVYAFMREDHTGEAAAPHSASFLMTRETFWKTGGYDETLSGHYGTDGDFRRRLAAVAPMQILTQRLIRHEYVGDSSTTHYLRKQPEDAAIKPLISARRAGWRPKALSFAYEEVQ